MEVALNGPRGPVFDCT